MYWFSRYIYKGLVTKPLLQTALSPEAPLSLFISCVKMYWEIAIRDMKMPWNWHVSCYIILILRKLQFQKCSIVSDYIFVYDYFVSMVYIFGYVHLILNSQSLHSDFKYPNIDYKWFLENVYTVKITFLFNMNDKRWVIRYWVVFFLVPWVLINKLV